MKVIRNSKLLNDKLRDLEEAYVFPLGDVHNGSSTMKEEEFCEYVDLAKGMDNAFIYWMGDLMELGGRQSPGISLFQQVKQPQEQYDWVIKAVEPLVDKSVLFHGANHERRAQIATGLDITKNLAGALKIPYAPLMAASRLVLKDQAYNVQSFHGAGGARLPHTKIQAHQKATKFFIGFDLLLMGHVHYNYAERFLYKQLDVRNKCMKNKYGWRVLTGHFLEWDDSYAEQQAMEPLPSGAPIIKLNGLEHEIKIMSIDDFK